MSVLSIGCVPELSSSLSVGCLLEGVDVVGVDVVVSLFFFLFELFYFVFKKRKVLSGVAVVAYAWCC